MATIVTASNGGYNEHYNELQEGGSFPGFTRQAYYFSRMFQNVPECSTILFKISF